MLETVGAVAGRFENARQEYWFNPSEERIAAKRLDSDATVEFTKGKRRVLLAIKEVKGEAE